MAINAKRATTCPARAAPPAVRRTARALLLALALLLSCAPRRALAGDTDTPATPPTRTLHGHLLERGTRAPLAGLPVALLDAHGEPLAETWTDADGAFALGPLPPGRFTLVVEETGFLPLHHTLELDTLDTLDAPDDATVALTLYVEPDADALATGGRAYETRAVRGAGQREPPRSVLDADEVEHVAAGRNDPLGALQALPGVARGALGGGAPALRGAPPTDSRATLDGIPLPRAFHPAGLRTLVPAALLERVDLWTSNVPIEHGNVLGGLVALELRPPARDAWHGRAAIDFVEAVALAEGPAGEHLELLLGARRSFVEVVTPFLADLAAVDVDSTPAYWDYLARVTARPGDGDHALELGALGAGDDARLVAVDDNGNRETLFADAAFHRAWARHRYRSRWLAHELAYVVGPETLSAGDDNSSYALCGVEHQLRETLSLRLDPALTLRLGADVTRFDGTLSIDARIDYRPVTLPDLDVSRWVGGAFLAAGLELADGVELELGGRVDHDSRLDALTGDLRARLSAARDGLRFVLALGSASQAPHPLDSVLLAEPPRWQRALHASVALAWQLPFYAPLTLELGAFHVGRDALPATVDSELPWLEQLVLRQTGEERSYGLELLLRHRLAHRFVGWISYTLARTEGRTTGDADWRRVLYDQPHNLQIAGTVLLPDRWRLSMRFAVVTGLPYTIDMRELLGTVVGRRFDRRFDVEPFHRLDLRVDKTWLFDLWQLSAWVDIEGVYLRENVDFAGYTSGGVSYSVTGLPILPSLGVAAQF